MPKQNVKLVTGMSSRKKAGSGSPVDRLDVSGITGRQGPSYPDCER